MAMLQSWKIQREAKSMLPRPTAFVVFKTENFRRTLLLVDPIRGIEIAVDRRKR